MEGGERWMEGAMWRERRDRGKGRGGGGEMRREGR